MRIDPVLAQLRRDPAPQQAAQAALEACRDAWRAAPSTEPLLAELVAFGDGAALADCPLLDAALAEREQALGLLSGLFDPLTRALRDNPLGHVPFRHQYSGGIAVLQLASAGRATLSLLCYEASHDGARERVATVCFSGGERHELCLAGAARVRVFETRREEAARAWFDVEERVLRQGDRLRFAGTARTKIVDEPLGRLIVLRLARSEECPGAAREYRIADGALVHIASGDRAESRDEMAAAVLGAMGRADAAPVLAAMAREGTASDHLRWQALRQTLGVDTASGFATLTAIARDAGDALAVPAGALRASLVERHPQLADLGAPCPA